MKNKLNIINSRLNITEEKINELKYAATIVYEIIKERNTIEEKRRKHQSTVEEFEWPSTWVTRLWEETSERQWEKYFKKQWPTFFQFDLNYRSTLPRSSVNCSTKTWRNLQYIMKGLQTCNKENLLKAVREKRHITYRGINNKVYSRLLNRNNVRWQWSNF